MSRKTLLFGVACVVSVTLCALILVKIMELHRADLKVPLVYWSDALAVHTFVKGMIDGGWYWENDFLGAPGTFQMYDYPMADNLHFAVMKLLSFAVPDFAVVANVYYLLTFPLITLSSLCVFRWFKMAYGPAILGSLLYSFLPYHFLRSQAHLFLSGYYLIPPIVMVILWVQSGQVLWRTDADAVRRLDLFSMRSLVSMGLCLLVSAAGVYYAFFACYLLLVGGLAGCIARRKIAPIGPALFLIGIVVLGVLANLYPSYAFWHAQGPNPAVGARSVHESELFALKIAQLFVPVQGHWIRCFRDLESRYQHQSSLLNTNDYLGAIGCCGFLLLLARLPRRRSSTGDLSLLDYLAILNIAALLLATIGGFSSLLSVLGLTSIRCYYRMSAYIAFFSLFAVVIALDRLGRRYLSTAWSTFLAHGLLGGLLIFGIADQKGNLCGSPYSSLYAFTKSEYQSDRAFVTAIEAALPNGALIFQLPYKPFPEGGGGTHVLTDYELFRSYLHSKSLRWSYGAMRNREVDRWQAAVVQKPIPQMLETLALAGFRGLTIDRNGFADAGATLERELGSLLACKPLVSANNRMVFLDLTAYRHALRAQCSAEEWQTRRKAALHPLPDRPDTNQ
ncbi:MAG TPA: hypothetical protein VKU02_28215 [Gemmataceae bacterium]|nr:hypothetical protein [Gemmataceae bacterium]